MNDLIKFIIGLATRRKDPKLISPVPEGSPDYNQTPVPTPTPTPTPVMANGEYYGRNPQTTAVPISDTLKQAILQASKQYEVPSALMYDVGMAENSLGASGKNKEGSSSTGAYQFNDETWKTVMNYLNMKNSSLKLPNTDRNDPLTSALAAAYLMKFGQLGRWNASKNDERNTNSWGKYWPDEELNKLGFYDQTK